MGLEQNSSREGDKHDDREGVDERARASERERETPTLERFCICLRLS